MKKYFIVCLLVVLSLVLTGMANAASTIGTNITTTGTFAQTTGSATAALFQKSSTLTALVVDTASGTGRVGVGAAPSTTFEVQGTASASYFFTQNAIQVAGVPGATATVAYSRFGTGTTGTPGEFASADDLLITGSLEVDGKASVASNFQMSGRFIADTAASHSFTGDVNISSYLVVGSATASKSGNTYVAEFVGPSTATVSILFGGSTASSKGTCFQVKNTVGDWRYVRIVGSTWTVNTIRCH